MASTNKTTNYELSQFQSSDIPAWLTDYNGDMQKIDAGIHAAKVQADGAANGVSALQTTVSGKQDRLTFDDAPTQNSSNPVKSGGVYAALQNVSVQTDAVPTQGSTKAVQSGGVYTALQGKQNTLTFDSMPTQNSSNPVTSGGVYAALQGGGAIPQILTVGASGSSLPNISGQAVKLGKLVIVSFAGFGGSSNDYITVEGVRMSSVPAKQYFQIYNVASAPGPVSPGRGEITSSDFSYDSASNSTRITLQSATSSTANLVGTIFFICE